MKDNRRLIENMIIIDLKNKCREYLIVNTINGLIDVISVEEYLILSGWKMAKTVIPKTEFEIKLYSSLQKRQYIMSEQEEKQEKSRLICSLTKKAISKFACCTSVTFILTYTCNFCCSYCYERNKLDVHDFTPEMVDIIFAHHQNGISNIGFFGGEPLMPKNLEIITYIISKAPTATYSVVTNGYFLDEFYPILSQVRIGLLKVTIDGTINTHNKSRTLKTGIPTYEKITLGLLKYLRNKIPVTIRMNVNNENIEECFRGKTALEEYFSEYMKYLSFEFQPLFQNSNIQKTELYSRILSHEKENIFHSRILPRLDKISHCILFGDRIFPTVKACDIEPDNRFYDCNGYIYTCILAVGNPKRSVGSFFPEYHINDTGYHTRSIQSIPECYKCKYALLCGGGCPNGVDEDDIMQPNCKGALNDLSKTIPMIYDIAKRNNR